MGSADAESGIEGPGRRGAARVPRPLVRQADRQPGRRGEEVGQRPSVLPQKAVGALRARKDVIAGTPSGPRRQGTRRSGRPSRQLRLDVRMVIENQVRTACCAGAGPIGGLSTTTPPPWPPNRVPAGTLSVPAPYAVGPSSPVRSTVVTISSRIPAHDPDTRAFDLSNTLALPQVRAIYVPAPETPHRSHIDHTANFTQSNDSFGLLVRTPWRPSRTAGPTPPVGSAGADTRCQELPWPASETSERSSSAAECC